MKTARIDEAILSVVKNRWTKVAMAIAKVADAMDQELPAGNERYEIISERIRALVQTGSILARGNTNNWRSSEIRLAE